MTKEFVPPAEGSVLGIVYSSAFISSFPFATDTTDCPHNSPCPSPPVRQSTSPLPVSPRAIVPLSSPSPGRPWLVSLGRLPSTAAPSAPAAEFAPPFPRPFPSARPHNVLRRFAPSFAPAIPCERFPRPNTSPAGSPCNPHCAPTAAEPPTPAPAPAAPPRCLAESDTRPVNDPPAATPTALRDASSIPANCSTDTGSTPLPQ